jgi:hypothetical protein
MTPAWRTFENASCTQFREQGTSALPLHQRHLSLRFPSKRSGEADLQSVVSSYSAGRGAGGPRLDFLRMRRLRASTNRW